MNRFDGLLRWGWSILVVCTLAFALGGCEGDDGTDGAMGAMGATGATGGDGADGADGPPGPGASVIPLESCGVCHDEGSFASAPAHHALDPIESVSNVEFEVSDDDLIVYFDLERDGTATAGYNTIQRGYRTDGVDRISIDVATLSDLTDNGDGSYSFTIPDGNLVAGDNRYMFRVAAGDDQSLRLMSPPRCPQRAAPTVTVRKASASTAATSRRRTAPSHAWYATAPNI